LTNVSSSPSNHPTERIEACTQNLIKSLLHNIGVVIVGFVFAFLGRKIDSLLGIAEFHSVFAVTAGCLFVSVGFVLRVWATFLFYERQMKVIKLAPQKRLITSGPYRFSRNPLYLGGNLFIFLGAVLFLGSPSGIVLTAINLVAVDFMIRREQRQLARDFGEEWLAYSNKVRRWL
jgi:protein-S-isoprenylcysteine O-methyltransferase Ste14